LQHILVAALAGAAAEAQVLHRVQIHRHTGHGLGIVAQAFQHLRQFRPLAARLEGDEQPAGVAGVVRPAKADGGGHPGHIRVAAQYLQQLQIEFHQLGVGDVLPRFHGGVDLAGVFFGEKAFRHGVEQPGGKQQVDKAASSISGRWRRLQSRLRR
jgi:hypothetical protein